MAPEQTDVRHSAKLSLNHGAHLARRALIHVDEELRVVALKAPHDRTRWSGSACATIMYPIRTIRFNDSLRRPVNRRLQDPGAPALVLLTATITPPPGVPALARTDPTERLEDYRRALEFYIGLPESAVDRIVFAENSAGDLSPLERVVEGVAEGKDVELVSIDGPDYPVQHGRGVGETRLIEAALSQSRLLRGLGDDGRFWKITGRLRFTNLERLIATSPEACALYADFRRFPRPWVDTRVFACTPAAFRGLFVPRLDLMRQDKLDRQGYSAPEQRLFRELLAERGRWRIVPRLRVEPAIQGYSGFDEDYARPARRLWSGVRAIARKVIPGLWI